MQRLRAAAEFGAHGFRNGAVLTSRSGVEHAAERHENRSHAGAWERDFLVADLQTSNFEFAKLSPTRSLTGLAVRLLL
jgi:hypothetical protein